MNNENVLSIVTPPTTPPVLNKGKCRQGLFTSQVLHMDCKQRSLREKRMLTENLIEELQPAENKKCRRSLFFPVDDLSGVSLTPPPNSKPQERSLSTIKLPVLKQRITKSDSMMEAKKEQLPLCPITPMVHNEIDSCRECVNLFSFFEEAMQQDNNKSYVRDF